MRPQLITAVHLCYTNIEPTTPQYLRILLGIPFAFIPTITKITLATKYFSLWRLQHSRLLSSVCFCLYYTTNYLILYHPWVLRGVCRLSQAVVGFLWDIRGAGGSKGNPRLSPPMVGKGHVTMLSQNKVACQKERLGREVIHLALIFALLLCREPLITQGTCAE